MFADSPECYEVLVLDDYAVAAFLEGGDGNFYRSTAYGGDVLFLGTVFRFTIAPSPSALHLDHERLNNRLVLSWINASFALQSAPAVTGRFTNILGVTNPYTNVTTLAQQFVRLISN